MFVFTKMHTESGASRFGKQGYTTTPGVQQASHHVAAINQHRNHPDHHPDHQCSHALNNWCHTLAIKGSLSPAPGW